MSNLAAPDIDALARITRGHGRHLQHREELLRAFIHHSPLSLRLR
jgi:hypothetical protein